MWVNRLPSGFPTTVAVEPLYAKMVPKLLAAFPDKRIGRDGDAKIPELEPEFGSLKAIHDAMPTHDLAVVKGNVPQVCLQRIVKKTYTFPHDTAVYVVDGEFRELYTLVPFLPDQYIVPATDPKQLPVWDVPTRLHVIGDLDKALQTIEHYDPDDPVALENPPHSLLVVCATECARVLYTMEDADIDAKGVFVYRIEKGRPVRDNYWRSHALCMGDACPIPNTDEQ